jgi:hypothetical protein
MQDKDIIQAVYMDQMNKVSIVTSDHFSLSLL